MKPCCYTKKRKFILLFFAVGFTYCFIKCVKNNNKELTLFNQEHELHNQKNKHSVSNSDTLCAIKKIENAQISIKNFPSQSLSTHSSNNIVIDKTPQKNSAQELKQGIIAQPSSKKFIVQEKPSDISHLINNAPSAMLPCTDASKTQSPIVQSNERIITISSTITQDMITYKKHWSGSYVPSFIMEINGQELKNGASTQVVIKNNVCEVSYKYDFQVWGKTYRSGGEILKFKVPENVISLNSKFSWDAPTRLIIENVELLSRCEIG